MKLRLKDLREDKDLKQEIIAKYLNIHQVVYSRYETGLRLIPIDKLNQLANFYNTSIDYIVGRTTIKQPYPKNKNNK